MHTLTENQIRALPLEERQKLVVELKDIQPGDKAYPNAKAIIELITSDKKYKEPTMVKVKALEDVPVDGRDVKKESETEVYPWQFRALSRFFELVTKAAAVIALLLVLSGFNAMAQQTVPAYTLTPVAGLLGGTNNVLASITNSSYGTQTITTNTIIYPNWITSNGTQVVTWTTNSTFTTNYPGQTSVANWASFGLWSEFALAGAGTSGSTFTWVQSADAVTWIPYTNYTVTAAGTATVAGGLPNLSSQYGYLMLTNIVNSNAQSMTNLTVDVVKKGRTLGP